MRVIFVHHSCFVAEVDELVLVFDYFAGDRVRGFDFCGVLPEYPKDTRIYMFASHSHRDHYDMDILRLWERYPNIRYLFSKDIRISPNFLRKHGIDPSVRERVTFFSPGKSCQVDGLFVTALQSTDAGVAYYVQVRGRSLFHAGDLNDWSMEGAGDLINGRVRRSFRHEIKKLSARPVDVAFFPVDPRLSEHRFDGIDFFLKNTDAKYVFPMHMWQDYSGIAAYKRRLPGPGMAERIVEITGENQVFSVE